MTSENIPLYPASDAWRTCILLNTYTHPCLIMGVLCEHIGFFIAVACINFFSFGIFNQK